MDCFSMGTYRPFTRLPYCDDSVSCFHTQSGERPRDVGTPCCPNILHGCHPFGTARQLTKPGTLIAVNTAPTPPPPAVAWRHDFVTEHSRIHKLNLLFSIRIRKAKFERLFVWVVFINSSRRNVFFFQKIGLDLQVLLGTWFLLYNVTK